MKYVLSALTALFLFAYLAPDANAFVCARGVYASARAVASWSGAVRVASGVAASVSAAGEVARRQSC
jgi:hypothetical protein